MDKLFDIDVWITVLAWVAFAAATVFYLRLTGQLTRHIDEHCPDLWPKLYRSAWSQQNATLYQTARGDRLWRLILRGLPQDDMPDDAAFRRLLTRTRWAALACFAFGAAGVVAAVNLPVILPPPGA